MPPAGSPGRPGLISREPVERTLGWLRLGAFVFGVVQTAIFPFATEAPAGAGYAVAGSYALSVVIGLVGLGTLLALRRDRTDIARLSRLTFAADTFVIIGLTLNYSFEAFGTTQLLLLVIPLEGALKFGGWGAAWAVAAVAGGEVTRNVLRTGLWGHDPLWNHATFLVGLAAITGIVTAQLSTTAERRRDESLREAARAKQLAAEAERSRQDLESLHRVILAGLVERPDEALERMLDEIQDQLGYPYLAVVLLDDDGEPYAAVSRGGDPELLGSLTAEPGGPTNRVLAGGPAEIVVGDELERLSHALPRTAVELVAPIRVRGEVIGALAGEHDEPPAGDGVDLEFFQRVADQMGLVIEAARAYLRERELAVRYQELDRLKTDFIAITSHELRTPLTAILGFAETLDTVDIDEEQRAEFRAGILRQARRLHRLIDDLSTVSRLDAGSLEVRPRRTNVRDVVDLAVEAADVPVDVAGAREDGWVIADPDRLGQVITNLLANAREHGEGQEVRLSWSRDDGSVRIRVRDEGPGIEPEERERIFDRFVQGGDIRTHQRGTGLGLAIARDLTHAMGGSLRLEHSETGASFLLELPAAGPDRPSAERTGREHG